MSRRSRSARCGIAKRSAMPTPSRPSSTSMRTWSGSTSCAWVVHSLTVPADVLTVVGTDAHDAGGLADAAYWGRRWRRPKQVRAGSRWRRRCSCPQRYDSNGPTEGPISGRIVGPMSSTCSSDAAPPRARRPRSTSSCAVRSATVGWSRATACRRVASWRSMLGVARSTVTHGLQPTRRRGLRRRAHRATARSSPTGHTSSAGRRGRRRGRPLPAIADDVAGDAGRRSSSAHRPAGPAPVPRRRVAAQRAHRCCRPHRPATAHPAGLPELRRALAAWIGRSRGVRVTADQVVVTAGAQGASTSAPGRSSPAGRSPWRSPATRRPAGRCARPAPCSSPVGVDADGLIVGAGATGRPAVVHVRRRTRRRPGRSCRSTVGGQLLELARRRRPRRHRGRLRHRAAVTSTVRSSHCSVSTPTGSSTSAPSPRRDAVAAHRLRRRPAGARRGARRRAPTSTPNRRTSRRRRWPRSSPRASSSDTSAAPGASTGSGATTSSSGSTRSSPPA